jgi:ABC-type uncharacterized transport system substrate-binding protein
LVARSEGQLLSHPQAVPAERGNPERHVLIGEEVQMVADTLGLKIVSLPVASGDDIPSAFTMAEKEGVTAVLIDGDPLMVRFSGTIVDECLVRDLPAMHPWPFEVRIGGLVQAGQRCRLRSGCALMIWI